MRTEEYIRTLTEQIRCKMARGEVTDEIRTHIEEQTKAYMSEGMERGEAEEAAVCDMGDPVEVGTELDRIHRPQMPWGMIAFIIILSVLGLGVQYFIQQRFVESGGDDILSWERRIVYMAVGLAVMAGVCFIDYTRIAARAREMMVLLFAALFLGSALFGVKINGAARWIALPGGLTLNIPMVLLLTVPLYAAVLYRCRGKSWTGIIKAVLWMLPGIFLAFYVCSFSTAAILLFSYVVVFGLSVWQGWYFVPRKLCLGALTVTALLPAVPVVYVMLFRPLYQWERLVYFLSPMDGWGKDISYTREFVRALLRNSRFLGEGGGLPASGMPEAPLNFLLAGVAAYFGLIAAVLLGGAVLALFIRFLKISLRQRNQLGMVMGTGCAVVFLIEILLYFMNNMGIIYAENYCPFLMNGGSGMVVSYLLMGIVLSIFRYQNTAPERRYPENRYAREKAV